MPVPRTVRPRKAELEPLQSAMRDIQVSIADYYRLTSGFVQDAERFTTPVRSTISFIQKTNDVLRQDFGQSQKYRQIFRDRIAAGDPGAETIEAIRYVRNVGSHQLHPVRPNTTRVVGNHRLGFRTSAVWQPIPPAVHRKTHPPTQALKPLYDKHMVGSSVLNTFLDASRFFAEVCPLVVHRDHDGEWTGFPLRSQAGVAERLHPMEPEMTCGDASSEGRSRRWLTSRKPGGKFRLLCGCVTVGQPYLVGLTFRDRWAYSPFTETVEQVRKDIQLGYPYYQGLPDGHLTTVGEIPDYGGVFPQHFVSQADPSTWIGSPLRKAPTKANYSTFGDLNGYWVGEVLKATGDRLVYREQRLAAWFPIR